MTVMDPVIYYLLTCGKKRVTLQDVVVGAERPRRPVLRVLDKLTRGGYLEEVAINLLPNKKGESGPQRQNPTWKIIGDLSDRPKQAPWRNTLQDKMWKLMRAKRYFTSNEIIITSGAHQKTVHDFFKKLEQAGYIRRTGKDGRFNTYMLTRDQVQRPIIEVKKP
ncbi:MAG: hypothetical protein OEV64_02270 [Desulfobulbaceae bacterium]|nr:hypothetical protein [Desulfobulbaceae bacterium]